MRADVGIRPYGTETGDLVVGRFYDPAGTLIILSGMDFRNSMHAGNVFSLHFSGILV